MLDWVFSPVQQIVGKSVKNSFRWMIQFLIASVLGALRRIVEAFSEFMSEASAVNLTSGWWTNPTTTALFRSMGRIALLLIVILFLAAIIDGVVHANIGLMLRTAFVQVPVTIFMTSALIAVVTLLLGLSDSISNMALGGGFDGASFLSVFSSRNVLTSGLLGVGFASLFTVGALFLWAELVIRAQIIYVLIMFAPIMLAMNVWPPLKRSWRRYAETIFAIIFAKPVIAITLAMARASIEAGGVTGSGGVAASGGRLLGAMLSSVVLIAFAVCSPFLIFRLLPTIEAATIGDGIMSKPIRGTQQIASLGYFAGSLAGKVGGGSGGGGSGGGAGGGGGSGSPGSKS